VIRSFKDKDPQAVFSGQFVKGLDGQIQQRAREKLKYLDSATELRDLMIPPANRLESLKGDRGGQYSIRINKKWRVCFKWKDGDAFEVEIWTATEGSSRRVGTMATKRLRPVHPGDILLHDFMQPLRLSSCKLAKELGVAAPTVNEIHVRASATLMREH